MRLAFSSLAAATSEEEEEESRPIFLRLFFCGEFIVVCRRVRINPSAKKEKKNLPFKSSPLSSFYFYG